MTKQAIYTQKESRAFKPIITQLVANIIAGQKIIEEDESKVIFEMQQEDAFRIKMVLSKRMPYAQVKGTVSGNDIQVIKKGANIDVVAGEEKDFHEMNYVLNKILSKKKRGSGSSKEDDED